MSGVARPLVIYTLEYQVYFRILMAEITTVKVTKRTREKLAELGKKNETYEDIIEKLIAFYNDSRNRKTKV